jgi:glutaredoxin
MNIKTARNKFSRIFLLLVFVVFVVAFSGSKVLAQEASATTKLATDPTLKIHLFYSETCPHCKEEKLFLTKMQIKYPAIEVKLYEVTTNKDNLKLFMEVGTKLGDKSGRVPFLVIGHKYILGYLSDETHGVQIEQLIIDGLKNPPKDLVEEIKLEKVNGTGGQTTQATGTKEKFEISFPILGKIDVNSLTLPVMTVVLGLADGFNPCAMWTLLFLISLLLGTKNKLKMWLLGGTFIITSGLVYFLFMAAWLNFFLIIGYATIVRVLIGLVAAGLGAYYLWSYWRDYKRGCLVEGDEKRQETFNKLRKLTNNDRIIFALLGMVLLALAVNVVELLCSAGIPAIYTKALTMTRMPKLEYYLYLLGYIFFYMLDDMVVFVVAMVTLQMVGIKQSYARYSHIIGGIIMLTIGILMLFKPEILMFS